jgi:dipeptidyl aminopeptidase/acylaminoacyl peptidase
MIRLEVTRLPVPLVEHVDNEPSGGTGEFRVSGSGTLAYVPQRPRAGRTLTWVAPDGRPTPIAVPAGAIETPRLSPDGTKLAFVMEQDDGRRHIWTYEFASGSRLQVTRDGDHWAPLWTKDGEALIFAKATAAGSDVILQPLQGGEAVTLGGSANRMFPGALTPDGQTVILTEMPPTDEYFLSQLTVGRPGSPQKLPIDARFPSGATLSPDGRRMAFVDRKGDRLQLFIQSYPSGPARQVTVDGGRLPVWSRDGRRLFYRSLNRMFVVSIDTARGLTWTAPQLLFEGDYAAGNWTDYDVAPDNRFVMVATDPREREPAHFNVVLNWRSELLSRVPVKP